MLTHIKKIETTKAPKAIGPYSQAIMTEHLLCISGQLPLNPRAGKILESTVEGQTLQGLDNIEAILKEAELTWENIVKTEVFLKDMNDFSAINALYAQRFPHEIKPSRQAFQVVRLPLDALIEISCISVFNKVLN